MYIHAMYIALASCFILPLFHATVVSTSPSCLIPHPLSLECTLKFIHVFICICMYIALASSLPPCCSSKHVVRLPSSASTLPLILILLSLPFSFFLSVRANP